MATQRATVTYASRSAVYGSNAYDLSRVRSAVPAPSEIDYSPARRTEIRPATVPAPKTAPRTVPSQSPARSPKTTPKAAPRSYRKKQKAYGISLYSAIGFVVIAVMMIFVLLAHVRYAEVTNETVKLQTQMTTLNEQERKLQIAYVNAFDINQVEQYATNQLGMSQPAESQIGTISVTAQDKAVVADTHQENVVASESIGTFLASLVAYFG
jgi:cell division protein FtsL